MFNTPVISDIIRTDNVPGNANWDQITRTEYSEGFWNGVLFVIGILAVALIIILVFKFILKKVQEPKDKSDK